jgi:hypothetical protein
MFAVNGNVANVSATIPPGQSSITVDYTATTIVIKDYVEQITGNASANLGLAVYMAKAPWNQSAYNANGFAGLNWSDWAIQSRFKDEYSELTTGNVVLTTSEIVPFNISPTGNTEIYALGFSSTVVPDTGDYTIEFDPISGISIGTYLRGFVGNTVIGDSSSGTTIFQYPGKSGSLVNATATGRLFCKVRIDK